MLPSHGIRFHPTKTFRPFGILGYRRNTLGPHRSHEVLHPRLILPKIRLEGAELGVAGASSASVVEGGGTGDDVRSFLAPRSERGDSGL